MKQTFTLLGFILLSITFCIGQSTLKESNEKKSFHELLQSSKSHFKALNTQAISKASSSLKVAISNSYSLDGYTDSYWNGSEWIVDETYEFAYNSNDLLSEVICYDTDQGEGWSGDKYLSTYIYDADGNLSAFLQFSWNETEGDWYTDAYYRELYTYDTEGNLTSSIASENGGTSWIPQYKIETTYNNYGYSTRTKYEYNTNTSSWDNLQIFERTYDSEGYVTLLTVSVRDNVNSDWAYMYGLITSTDSENHVLSYSAYDGDPNDSNSSIEEKGVFTFENGNISTVEYQVQNESENWYTNNKEEYNYDTNYSISEILMPSTSNDCFRQENEINSEFNNKILSLINYEEDESGNLSADEKLTYIYTDLTTPTSIDDSEELSFELYPNPAYNNVSIIFSSVNNEAAIQLFDMLGKKVLDKKINSEESINIEHLTSGIYLYKIVIDGQSQSGKLLKK